MIQAQINDLAIVCHGGHIKEPRRVSKVNDEVIQVNGYIFNRNTGKEIELQRCFLVSVLKGGK